MITASGPNWELRLGRWQDSPPDQVDHVITDPPFTEHVSQHAKQRLGLASRSKSDRLAKQADDPDLEVHGCVGLSFGGVVPAEVAECIAYVSRWSVLKVALEQLGEYRDASPETWKRSGWWAKTNAAPQFTGDRPGNPGEGFTIHHAKGKSRWNRGGHKAEWRGPTAHGTACGPWDDRIHETQMPLWLAKALVEDFTDPGDRVWDPYAGSATIGVACLLLGRRYLGHEMQSVQHGTGVKPYFEEAAERLAAAEQGLSLPAKRSGQLGMFG